MNLLNLLRHISLKRIRLQKAQFLIAVSTICLAVAAMVSIDTVTGSVIHSSETSVVRIACRADLQITGAQSGFPAGMLDMVRRVRGVEHAVPVIRTCANVMGRGGLVLNLLGVDPLEDIHIRDYSLTCGSAKTPNPLSLLEKPDSILLTRTMAQSEGIRIGQPIKLLTVEGVRAFEVRGLLDPKGPANTASGDTAVMDIVSAGKAFGMEGRIDRIDVSILPGEKPGTVKERIELALPKGYSVEAPADRAGALGILIGRYTNALASIGLLAILVGMYLIYMTVSIWAVQRKKETGILRALGARKRDIVGLFLAEVLAAASLGSILGIGLGLVLAKLSLSVFARSVTEMYVRASAGGLIFSLKTVLRDSGIAIFASLAAALLPVMSISRIPPASAMRSVSYPEEEIWAGKKFKIASAVCIIFFILASRMAVSSDSVSTGFAAAFAAIIFLMFGVSFLIPLYLKKFTSFFHDLLCSRLGIEGRLACLNLQRGLTRNSVAVSAIIFSICLLVAMANQDCTLRKAICKWQDNTVHADLVVSSGNPFVSGGNSFVSMPAGLSKELGAIRGVRSVGPYYKTYLVYRGRKVLLAVFDFAERMRYCRAMLVKGSKGEVARLLPGRDNVVVNEAFALKYHVKPGDSLLLPTQSGLVRFGVAAVGASYLSTFGVIEMDINTFRRHWADGLVDSYDLHLLPEANIANVRRAIFEKIGKNRKLFVLTASQMDGQAESAVDHAFSSTGTIYRIALVIAGLGIVITLLASVLERTREIGVLRSIGMKRSQIAVVVVVESILMGVAGWLLGSLAGILAGWVAMEGYFRVEFGNMAYHVNYAFICWAFLLAVGLSVLAGIYPAMRAAGANVLEALNYE